MTKPSPQNLRKAFTILIITTCVWFLLDRITKVYFDSGQFSLGQDISDSILGIFHLTLVHNTGAAFGIFANGTIVLGVISIVISLALLALPLLLELYNTRSKKSNKPAFQFSTIQLLSVAIVAAGGIGNAIDRFVTGYVVDFICFDFIDFPVFNIADIGVTCGILILVTNLLYLSFKRQ